ncbi:hypothetical protein [Nocardiopsis sp. MG754419]|uniref:hypothetical protein n=1 Tax=Nocardiopsis sp. MG754419 TaxID=2259865 RepID=UPI001BA755FA|nr:hypothetical protein [Nocardiopsis sp. MG754419]MBR8744528.1 hypothetical protein [Nocardiopsis sp. MG754419]
MTIMDIVSALYVPVAVAAAVACGVTARRWRSRHPDTRGLALAARAELPGFGGPFSSVRWEAQRAVGRGRAVDDPRTAYVVRLTAAERLHGLTFHWSSGLVFLGLAFILPVAIGDLLHADEAGRAYVRMFVLLLLLALLTIGPFHIRRTLRNARRALEVNADRALAFAAVVKQEEARARAAYEEAERAATVAEAAQRTAHTPGTGAHEKG